MAIVLNNEDIRSILDMNLCLSTLEAAYKGLGERKGRAVTGPRIDVLAPKSDYKGVSDITYYSLKAMSAIVGKYAAVRINTDLLHWPIVAGAVRRKRVPGVGSEHNITMGMILLFSTETAQLVAILNDGWIQNMRVGATGGLAAKYLSREDSRMLGILGSGHLARTHAMAICKVRKIEEIRVFSPVAEHREKYAIEMGEVLNVPVIPTNEPKAVMQGADIGLTATNSLNHVLKDEWVGSGMHIGNVKICEMEPSTYRRADILVLHSKKQVRPEVYKAESDQEQPEGLVMESQKGHIPGEMPDIPWDTLPDMVDVVMGRVRRSRPEEVTFFYNNVGLGLQFAAVGGAVYEHAKELGIGKEIPIDWNLEVTKEEGTR